VATLSITVPDTLAPRVVAAFRGQYPDLTAGLTDAAAARAVIRHIVRTTVTAHESRLVRAQQQNGLSTAEQQAWTDTDAIG
jgi:Spy/CpxP family protein refolding chaperone